MALDLSKIKEILEKNKPELAARFCVKGLGIFGSYVRGEAKPSSDVDILVEFEKPVGFFKFLELEEKLGELLGVKVDLVTKAALKPYIGRHILSEVSMV